MLNKRRIRALEEKAQRFRAADNRFHVVFDGGETARLDVWDILRMVANAERKIISAAPINQSENNLFESVVAGAIQ